MALSLGGIGQSFAAGKVGQRYFDSYYRAKTYNDQKAKMKQQNDLKLQQMQLQEQGLDLQERRLGMQEEEFQAKQKQKAQEMEQRQQIASMVAKEYGLDLPDTGEVTGTTKKDAGPIVTPKAGLQLDDAGLLQVTPQSSRSDLIFRAHQTAEKYGLDPRQFVAMIESESAFKPGAQSPPNTRNRGRAQGLGQFIPGTAKMMGLEDPFDPAQNLDAAARYIVKLGGKEDFDRAIWKYHGGGKDVTGMTSDGHVQKVRKNMERMAKEYDGVLGAYSGSPDISGLSEQGPAMPEKTGNFYDDLADDLGAVAAGAMDAGVSWFKEKLGNLHDRALAAGDVETARDIAESQEQMVGEDAQGNVIALPDSSEVQQLQQQGQPITPRVVSRKEVTSGVMNYADRLEALERQKAEAEQRVAQTKKQGGLDLMQAATTGDIAKFPTAQRQVEGRIQSAKDDVAKIDEKIFQVREKMAKAVTKAEQDSTKMEKADLELEKLKAETKTKQGELAAKERMNFGKPVTSTMTKDTDDTIKNIDSYGKFLGSADDEFFSTVTGLQSEAKIRDALIERFGGDSPRIQWWKDYDIFKNQIRNQLFGSALTAVENEIFNASNINKATNPDLAKEYLRRQLSMSMRAIRINADKLVAETNDNYPGVGRMMGHLEPIAMLDDRVRRAGDNQEAIAQAQNEAANALFDFMSSAGVTDSQMIMSTAEDLFANKAELKQKYLGGNNGRTMETGTRATNPAGPTTPGIDIRSVAPAITPGPAGATTGSGSGLTLGAGA